MPLILADATDPYNSICELPLKPRRGIDKAMNEKQNKDSDARIARLRALVEKEAGGKLSVFEAKHPEVNANYLSQLLKGHRTFGEKAARSMESRCGLPNGYFDSRVGIQPLALSQDEVDLLDAFHAIPTGWQFYLLKRAKLLKQIGAVLPDFVFDSFRPIPDDSAYFEWEAKFEDFIKEQAHAMREQEASATRARRK